MTTEQSDGADKGFRASQNVTANPTADQKFSLSILSWRDLYPPSTDTLFEATKTLIALLIVAAAIFFSENLDIVPRVATAVVAIGFAFTLAQMVRLSKNDEEVETSPRVLHDTLEHMPHGLAHWDANAQLLWCNKAYRKLMGLGAGKAEQGAPYAEIMTEAANPISFDARKDDEHHRVVMAKCADDKVIRIEDISDPDHHFVTVITDNTEHHKATQDKKNLEQQYRELAKQYHAEKKSLLKRQAAQRLVSWPTLAMTCAPRSTTSLGLLI